MAWGSNQRRGRADGPAEMTGMQPRILATCHREGFGGKAATDLRLEIRAVVPDRPFLTLVECHGAQNLRSMTIRRSEAKTIAEAILRGLDEMGGPPAPRPEPAKPPRGPNPPARAATAHDPDDDLAEFRRRRP